MHQEKEKPSIKVQVAQKMEKLCGTVFCARENSSLALLNWDWLQSSSPNYNLNLKNYFYYFFFTAGLILFCH